MTKKERAVVIRQSSKVFRVQPGKTVTFTARGIAIAGNPGATCNVIVEVKTIRLPKPKPEPWRSSVFGRSMHEEDRRKGWIEVGDPKPRPTVRIKRPRGKSALGKIAEKMPPKKLKLGSDLKGPAKCAALRQHENKSPEAQSVS